MDIGVSLILIAIGAILAFAIDARVAGIDIAAIGVILMLAGGAGLVITLLFLASFAPFPMRRRSAAHYDVAEPAAPPAAPRYTEVERTVYREAPHEPSSTVERTVYREEPTVPEEPHVPTRRV